MSDEQRVIRWIFFDVGDTLLDEREAMFDWCGQVADSLRRQGRGFDAADVWRAREGAYQAFAPDVLSCIAESLGFSDFAAEVYRSANYRHALERPFPDTTRVLRELSSTFRLGVIANQSAGTAQRLSDHGWGDLFSVCVSSTEEGVTKPDPAIFRLALQRAGCRAGEAVMVGDRLDNDIAPAKAIGMATIRIRQGLAAVQEAREESQQPDVTIATIAQLPAALRQLRRR